MATRRARPILPGFGLALGFTLTYLGLLVLLPLAVLVVQAGTVPGPRFWALISGPRALAAFRLSFGAAFLAAALNGVCGLLVAWVLVRYRFPGRAIIDGLIDLPFALPTAARARPPTAVYAPNGWIGRLLALVGVKAAFSPLGVVMALTFIGLPFVVRTVQPVLRDLDRETEEAALLLGAGH